MLVRRSHAQRRLSLGELKPIQRRTERRIDHRRSGTVAYGSACQATGTPHRRGNAIEIQAKQRALEVAQMNPTTGLSDDFINKLASIHMRLQLCLSFLPGDAAKAVQFRDRIREQLAELPSYTDYAKEELLPKVAGLVEGKAPRLEARDVLNEANADRIEALDRVCAELRATVEGGVEIDHLLGLLHDGYTLVKGEDFAEEKIAPLRREIGPKTADLEALLQG